MPTRVRRRIRDFWHYCRSGGRWHESYCPYPPPWWLARPTDKEQSKDLKEYIEMLRKELKNSLEQLNDVEKSR